MRVDGSMTFDFRRRTASGVPFRFSTDMTDNNPATLVADIVSFVDAFHPAIFAREWCRLAEAGESRRNQIAADMDGIRSHAWLLAVAISEAFGNPESNSPPWYLLN